MTHSCARRRPVGITLLPVLSARAIFGCDNCHGRRAALDESRQVTLVLTTLQREGGAVACYIWGTVRSNMTRCLSVRWIAAFVTLFWLFGPTAEHGRHVALALDPAHDSITVVVGSLVADADHALCSHETSPWCSEAMAQVTESRLGASCLLFGNFQKMLQSIRKQHSIFIKNWKKRDFWKLNPAAELM